jgi:hypothetical protein
MRPIQLLIGRRSCSVPDICAIQTHRFQFDYAGILERGGRYPRELLKADGVSLKYPLIDSERSWLFKTGGTIWYYPYHQADTDYPEAKRNYTFEDAQLYWLRVNPLRASRQAGAVWVIRTDRNLIGVQEGSQHVSENSIRSRHSGFASTGLADIFTRVVYATREWGKAVPVGATPVVPEPGRDDADTSARFSKMKPN